MNLQLSKPKGFVLFVLFALVAIGLSVGLPIDLLFRREIILFVECFFFLPAIFFFIRPFGKKSDNSLLLRTYVVTLLLSVFVFTPELKPLFILNALISCSLSASVLYLILKILSAYRAR